MDKKNYNRNVLTAQLASAFLKDFQASIKDFSDEQQIDITESLIEAAIRFEKKEDYNSVYISTIDPLLKKYRSKFTTFVQRNLPEYFLQESNKLLDLMADKNIQDDYNQFLTDEEYKSFMWSVKNVLYGHRQYVLLNMPPEGEMAGMEPGKTETPTGKNKEHTARRRALFLHYLDKHFHLAADKKPLAEIGYFLTGNSEDNLYKYLRNPLNITPGEKRISSEQSLKKDLQYVKRYFERLEISEIVNMIEKDLSSI